MEETRDSFQTQIANRYGAVIVTKVKEFVRLRIKRKKLECGLKYVVQCRDCGVIPTFTRIKPVQCIRDCSEFFRVANIKLLRRVITECRQKVMYTNKQLYNLHLELSQKLHQDLWQVLDAMTYNRTASIEQNTIHRHHKKLNNLICKQQHNSTARSYPHSTNINREGTPRSEYNNVVNLSSCELSDDATRVLSRGLNFAPAPRKIPYDNIITSVEDTLFRNKVPHRDAESLRQDIATMLRKLRPPHNNMTRAEMVALRSLRNNTELLVLPADKGNATVVVDTFEYEQKMLTIVSDATIYKKVNYNPTARVTAKVLKLLHQSSDEDLVTRLRPRNPSPPKIYGLPKIHKPDWPLRPIVSQIDAPTYQLSKHLASILQSLVGMSSSHVRDSRHFVHLIEDVCMQPDEVMVSFDVASLFTNVPVEDAVKIITDLIHATNLPTECIQWTEYCLKSGYFVWRGEYYLQVDGVAMGSPIAPVVANIFMEWFESNALSNATLKPRYWWRYVDDIFAIISKRALYDFTMYLNSIHRKIQFTVEEEQNGSLPFLDIRVIRKSNGRLAHTVYRKPTHTDIYLQAESHHHPSHLASVSRTLINRALQICGPQYVDAELNHVRSVLEKNGFNWNQCTQWASSSKRQRPSTVDRSPVYLPFLKGVTDKIGHYLKRKCGVRTIFRPPGQLRRFLRSPKDTDTLNTPGVYKIPCDCGQSYIGETRRNVSTRVTEHIRSVKNLDTVRSAVAEHAQIPGARHFLRFDKTAVLARERFYVPRKVREAIEIRRHPNFNRDNGWHIPPAWIPVLNIGDTSGLWKHEDDTTSTVCKPASYHHHHQSDSDNDTLSDNDSSDSAHRDNLTDAAQPSQRQLRAEARARRLARS